MSRRAVIVTGSEGGIGHEIVQGFTDEGVYVIGIDRLPISRSGCDAYIEVDLNSLAHEKRDSTGFQKEILSVVDGFELIGLVNNAAVQMLGEFEDLDLNSWSETLRINLLAPVELSRLLMGQLISASGSIINISSVHAVLTKPEFSAYAVSKAALLGLTRSLAVEVGERVRTIAICPAAIETELLRSGFEGHREQYEALVGYHPTKAIGEPKKFADFVVMVTLTKDVFLNGAIINYDGGISHRLHDPV